MSGANFSHANLHEAKLTSSALAGADFRQCFGREIDADNADFSHARLELSDFTEAKFYSVNLHRAKLNGARFEVRTFSMNVEEAVFDEITHLPVIYTGVSKVDASLPPWLGCTSTQRDYIRNIWREKGARSVSDGFA